MIELVEIPTDRTIIAWFRGQYRFLSNFHPARVEFEGSVYPSVEHAYVAAKTFDRDVRKRLAYDAEITAGQAKRMGRKVELRPDWDEVKVRIMYELLHEKFRDPELRQWLSELHDVHLIEGNFWHDQYWGSCACPRHAGVPGKNILGRLLMRVRDEGAIGWPPPAPRIVDTLEPHQVFVFGSNLQGFHGAGSAGKAMRNEAANTWRQDERFLRAMKAPEGHPDRIGHWAVFGCGLGYQEGHCGKSYAIPTVTRPGARCSVPLEQIGRHLQDLGAFARQHPKLEFLVHIVGGGYNGWTVEEMRSVYRTWCREDPPPANVRLLSEYEFRTQGGN